MKRYTVTIVHLGREYVLDVTARNETSAKNKAVRRAQYMVRFIKRDKTITVKNVVSVVYEGFYLARKYFAVNPVIKTF